ncbi:uncharacterized protein LOC133849001 [Drosophila sulfurigaster albostrigata]|uniref:uncharacterized protein LOC133849001 n=1 Tax=Drosophila sulfurigaster albostrigata TaxID=89887 RepID=UPI002D218B28|nr:uncharacterized protein LOC133849001 [Drosophila sulfurigaster albostrigata]
MSKQCLRQPRHSEATSTAITAITASGRSDRECGAVRSIDNIDHTSLRSATRSRPLARLDRLLRRWLPGYNYLRGPIAPIDGSSSSHSHSHSRPSADILGAGRSTSRLQQQQDTRNSVTVEVTASSLPMQKRKDGEVLLDAGIAKSEFCMKLEKLLRAKLIVKE